MAENIGSAMKVQYGRFKIMENCVFLLTLKFESVAFLTFECIYYLRPRISETKDAISMCFFFI